MNDIKVGDVVKATPIGQSRRQTMKVTRVDDEFATGLLVSRKYPGDFRGYMTAWVKDCVKEG